ncbi:MAG: DNA mismatch repair endonuclease MutL [Prevotella sp.]|nr:DNA mismatch repair endonuclease MutL [Prevotella sp.]MBR1839060.1 DNA mismatch repair endonuclease MutL [Prevotella sp.]
MDIIQLLPDSVANQIAAGEVIQRPASVIKELVENAIDAGATHIQVLVCDAGKSSVQVIDDGCGMSDTDARLSFERHATSKIRQATDLFSLHTMGFRGEALASIAAVAQVTLQTRTKDNEVGTRIRIDGSRLVEQEIVSCPVGSNFLVENLFFNIPARRKFLKSNATEMSNITQAFERIVLVYPEINFSLYSNGQEMLNLKASNFHRRIVDVFGKRLNQQLLSVEADTTVCKISGFVGKPESARKKGNHQYFFVNGRYMKHPYFHKAVLTAFDRLLPDGEQVSYFINFTVNPEDIDVNIHPVKTEIKFENEQVIWQILMAAVRDSVGKFSEVTSFDFDTEGKPDIPVFNPHNSNVSIPHIDYNPNYNPFTEQKAAKINITGSQRAAKGWEELFGEMKKTASDKHDEPRLFDMPPSSLSREENISEETLLQNYSDDSPLMQHSARYIFLSLTGGVAIIDQHRASIRVLYEQYMRNLRDRSSHTQKVLFPEVVQFPPSYAASLDSILDELRALGFDITDLGGGSYSVAGIPSGLGGMDAVSLVGDLVAEAFEQGMGATERVHSILAQGLAERAAIPYGEILDEEAMRSLLRQLSQCESLRYTPDGKKIIKIMSDDDFL